MSYNQIHYSNASTAGQEIQSSKIIKCNGLIANYVTFNNSEPYNILDQYTKLFANSVVIPFMKSTTPNNNSIADIRCERIGKTVTFTIYPKNIGAAGVYGSYKSLIPESLGSPSIAIDFSVFGSDIQNLLYTTLPSNGLITACLIYEDVSLTPKLRPYAAIFNQRDQVLILRKEPNDPSVNWTDLEQIFSIQVTYQVFN